MKVSIDIDVSPLELRKLMGLPDVEAFQQELMEAIRERMAKGAEGYDPVKLFQPYLASTFASWDAFQKMLAGAMSAAGGAKPPGAASKSEAE